MKIPRYWVKATEQVPGRKRAATVIAWGWSDAGEREAAEVARRRLARLIERIRAGESPPRAGYLYADRPLREEIVAKIRLSGGPTEALVTRNSYGSLVLNTANVMFVDIDLPEPPKRRLIDRLLRTTPKEDREGKSLETLRAALVRLSGGFRIYRTAAGWRVVATDRLFEPTDSETQMMMTMMGADKAYQALCRIQESFRARLTAKPWRCGVRLPPGRYPRDESEAKKFAKWLSRYDAACAGWSTCRFVETVGSNRVFSVIRPLIDYHDASCGIESRLPLA